ncbi:hypothetical protein CR969_01690 [Candidatus Saccharibacteria bacterium]|nr:MAG: hypothetical protein CR969_01690 [Candidatus Saccharibacteria bacterium]
MWVLQAVESDGKLTVTFPDGDGKPAATHTFDSYGTVRVASSMGQVEHRFKVRIPVVIKGRRILARFTLSDRSSQVYPVLIGRSTLMHKFVVDVAHGKILKTKEAKRSRSLGND